MPPREKAFDAWYLVIDVGGPSSGSGYLDQAIKCASGMVQRKIYSEGTERYGLVLVGTRKSDNDLGYRHVCVPRHSAGGGDLVVASFELVKFIEEQIKSFAADIDRGDWLDGLVVAMDRLVRNAADSPGMKGKHVTMLTDMGCAANDSKLWEIMDSMKRQNISLTFIHPDWPEDGENAGNDGDNDGDNGGNRKPKSEVQESGCLIMNTMMENVETSVCSIADAQIFLSNKERRKKRPFPWKVDLEIGPDIRIPTAGYIRTRREAPKTWKKTLSGAHDEIEELKPETTFVRDNEDQEVVEPTELVDAYKYGSEICPVNRVDQENAYQPGPKCFSVVGFASDSEIPLHLMVGEGCMVFQPVDGDEFSGKALSAFYEALVEEKMAAVVRKVYRQGTAPRLGALIPEIIPDNEGEEQRVLVFIELPFAEDLRHYQFAPLWTDKSLSDDQLGAVDDLIDSMMLPTPEENPDKAIETTKILNPYYQHLYKCLTQRALNPSKAKGPPAVDDDVKSFMEYKGPKSNDKALEKLKGLFKLETVFKKKEVQTGASVFADTTKSSADEPAAKRLRSDDLALDSNSVTSVGTVTPADDFRSLLSEGFLLESISSQLETVIFNLIRSSFGDQMVDKVTSCLNVYREACVQMKKSLLYNTFVKELRDLLKDLKRGSMMEEIAKNHLGLIHKMEDENSEYSKEAAEVYFVTKDEVEAEEKPKEDEVQEEDLLDDL